MGHSPWASAPSPRREKTAEASQQQAANALFRRPIIDRTRVLISSEAPFPGELELPAMIAPIGNSILQFEVFAQVVGDSKSGFNLIACAAALAKKVASAEGPQVATNSAATEG